MKGLSDGVARLVAYAEKYLGLSPYDKIYIRNRL